MTQKCQEIDTQFISGVRNFLFANQPDADPGPSGPLGLDLAALNFQRGRDHGIADFNTLRNLIWVACHHFLCGIDVKPTGSSSTSIGLHRYQQR